jgi:hypothetical protein
MLVRRKMAPHPGPLPVGEREYVFRNSHSRATVNCTLPWLLAYACQASLA